MSRFALEPALVKQAVERIQNAGEKFFEVFHL
jgi:hypothetical protein